jgi:exosortase A-associated hydrolase 2
VVPHPEPFFLSVCDGPLGQRFALYHPQQADTPRGLVVYVHPFAEEMNKSRRMAALQSRALAAAGFAVLQMDLLGCGDSGGDFGDATWSAWVDDVLFACRWLRLRHPVAAAQSALPLWLWGLRAGCLLAAEAAARLDAPEACGLLLWQPAPAGNMLLQQFLRLKAASDMLVGNGIGAVAELRRQLAAGDAVEVAGYRLNPALAAGLNQAALRPPVRPVHVEWLELNAGSSAEAPALSSASAHSVLKWQQAGCSVRVQVVRGPAFWQTTEIEESPELLVATLAAVSHGTASDSAPRPASADTSVARASP